MRFLIIGSGGRESVIAWRLMKDGSADEVYVLPGNGGIDKNFRVNIDIDDFTAIDKFCEDKKIDFIVVGPEAPLVAGLVDYLEEKGRKVFGPSKQAAQLEGSKLFAKSIMEKYDIPTAKYVNFDKKVDLLEYIKGVDDFPIVIKLDGLAAGKGVYLPENIEDALIFVEENVGENQSVFVEEFLDGEEASVLGICDGENVLPLVAAQDHKRIGEGDIGPNTGGMGAYAPAPVVTPERLNYIYENILKRTVDGMKKEGIPFKGVLYAGVMISGDKINVLEYNVRFGDPEIQVILPLLKNRLGDLFFAATENRLNEIDIQFEDKHTITVVMASEGYPGKYEKGREILGLDNLPDDIVVFHAGTKEENGKIYTNGGRVLNVTAMDSSLEGAREKVYSAIEKIKFKGAYFRKDIAHRAIKK